MVMIVNPLNRSIAWRRLSQTPVTQFNTPTMPLARNESVYVVSDSEF
jgi:hypothetical protein